MALLPKSIVREMARWLGVEGRFAILDILADINEHYPGGTEGFLRDLHEREEL